MAFFHPTSLLAHADILTMQIAAIAAPETMGRPQCACIDMATRSNVTGLPRRLPVRIGGRIVGGFGVGSGRGDQDIAGAALPAVGAAL